MRLYLIIRELVFLCSVTWVVVEFRWRWSEPRSL